MREKLEEAIKLIEKKTLINIEYFGEKFPSATTCNYVYDKVDNEDWTEGFWTGILWMLYETTGNKEFKQTALKNLDSFQKRLENNIVLDHHDLGFLYSLSSVAAYQITESTEAKKLAISAAYKLLSRWHDNPGFIQAWGAMDDKEEHRFIIDSLLNLPLLRWAYDQTNDKKFKEVIHRHYNICVDYLIRDDGSSYHTYYVNPESKLPSHGLTAQGFSDDSSWARGQAWAVYGIALNYSYNPTNEKLEKFIQVTDFFIKHLPSDYVSYWDLIFGDGSNQEKDSGATAIVICGILEMLPYIEDEELSVKYKDFVLLMIESLIDNYANREIIPGAPLLNEGVYSWHENKGVNEGNLWGDYFYVEAIIRLLNKNWKTYW